MDNMLQRFLRTRYVALLESELDRLRAENRALTNSLLGTAGFPAVDFPATTQRVSLARPKKPSWYQLQTRKESEAARAASRPGSAHEL